MKRFKIRIGPIVINVISERNIPLKRFSEFKTNKNEDYTFFMKKYRKVYLPTKSKIYSEDFAVKFFKNKSQTIIKPKQGNWSVVKNKNQINLFANRFDVENVLNKRILAVYLMKKNSFLIHSSGVIFQRRYSRTAILFVGKCGSGKSTICKFFKNKGFDCLSDELNIISLEKGKLFCYGTPAQSNSKCYSNEKAELECIFFIKKAKSNRIKPLIASDFFNNLITHSLMPYDSNLKSKFMRKAIRCATSIKSYELKFRKDKKIVDNINDFLTYRLLQKHH